VPPAAEAMVAPRLMPPLLIFRQRELVAANMKLRRQRNAAVLLDEVTGVARRDEAILSDRPAADGVRSCLSGLSRW
jgi:hypothetical protein